jgi:hypothetical protein
MKKIILLIILFEFFFISNSMFCQYSNNICTKKLNDFFVKFQKPVIPNEIKKIIDREISISILVEISIDTNGNISSLKFDRIFKFGNDLDLDDPLWSKCEESIKMSSKGWICYPDPTFKELHENFKDANSKFFIPKSPYGFSIIFCFSNDSDVDFNPNKVYSLGIIYIVP